MLNGRVQYAEVMCDPLQPREFQGFCGKHHREYIPGLGILEISSLLKASISGDGAKLETLRRLSKGRSEIQEKGASRYLCKLLRITSISESPQV